MKVIDLLKNSLRGINTHKNRSALTILGIVIGIASIVVVISVGESAESVLVSEVESFGPANVFILPGKEPKGPTSFGGTLLNDSLTIQDFEDLKDKNNVPYTKDVVPYVFGPKVFSYEGEKYRGNLIGSTPGIVNSFDLEVETGDFFSNFDVGQKSNVVIIGREVKDKLFGLNDALDKKIKIGDKKFKIIGVLSSGGKSSFVDMDGAVLAPYTAVQQYVLGIRHFQRITVEAESVELVPDVIDDIERTIRGNHNIENPENDDFFIQTQDSIANTLGSITGIFTTLLAFVAAISLLVGGVGIMNIMLVSITERTREIGLRKALGATNRSVLSQFLVEAVILTLTGGFLGIILGLVFAFTASFVVTNFFDLTFPFLISPLGVILGLSVSGVVGLIFGIFPAIRASKKDPIEALRYE